MLSHRKLINLLTILIAIFFSSNYFAGLAELGNNSKNKIIPIEQAFQFSIDNNLDKKQIEIFVKAAPKTYLYKKNFKFNLLSKNIKILRTNYPSGILKKDEVFGDVEVFEGDFKIDIPYEIEGSDFENPVEFKLGYQGCLSNTYCYPPQTKTYKLNFLNENQNPENGNSAFTLLEKASFWQIILGFFIFGILLSFTPCVLPMIPILSSVIIGKCKVNNKHIVHHNAFLLSLTYVTSMSLVYALAGILVATAGQNLQAYLQSPSVIIVITILFVALALSMFGLYEITVPHFIEDKIGSIYRKQQGGSYLGAAIMGVIATLIVSPCTSAPLAGALLYIATTGNTLLGAFALFSLSFGMGIPLLVIGLSSRKLLPKAGQWMENFKNFFGVILLGMAIFILGRIIPDYITLGLWGVLLITYAVIIGLLEPAPSLKDRFIKAFALIIAIIGMIYLIGAANYNTSTFEPLKNFSHNKENSSFNEKTINAYTSDLNWIRTNSLQGYNSILNSFNQDNSGPQFAIVDFTADWCSICQKIKRTVFNNSEIKKQLEKLFLIEVDVTEYNNENKELMQILNVFNPPTILFIQKNKGEITKMRITGDVTPSEFNKYLSQLK